MSDEVEPAPPLGSRRSPVSRYADRLLSDQRIVLGAVALASAVLMVWWGVRRTEWSFVDDAGLKVGLRDSTHKYGDLDGAWHTIYTWAKFDSQSWGLFRPVWWVYNGTFYMLGDGAAHAVRMAMVVFIVGLPLLAVYRRTAGPRRNLFAIWALALLLANRPLYLGIALLSLQEVIGLTFVAIGVVVEQRRSLRTLMWLGAAWSKAPFAWLLVGWGLVELARWRRTRVQSDALTGGISLALGIATLVVAGVMARHGSYTQPFHISLSVFRSSLHALFSEAKVALLIALIGIVGFRVPLRRLVPSDGLTVALAIGGVGYAINMLPWTLGRYYSSPVLWLLGTAFVLTAAAGRPELAPRSATTGLEALSALAGLVLAVNLAHGAMSYDLDYENTLVGLRQWAGTLPANGVTIAINGPEPSVRLPQVMALHDKRWHDTVIWVKNGEMSARHPDYYIHIPSMGAGTSQYERRPILTWHYATVFATH